MSTIVIYVSEEKRVNKNKSYSVGMSGNCTGASRPPAANSTFKLHPGDTKILAHLSLNLLLKIKRNWYL